MPINDFFISDVNQSLNTSQQALVSDCFIVPFITTAMPNPFFFTNSLTTGGTSSSFSGCTGGNITSATTIIFPSPVVMNEIVIDEDDLMNNQEYWELARQRGVQFRIRTAEERQRQEAEAARVRVEQERTAALRREAKDKSLALLIAHLTAEQRETFTRNKWFVVIGGQSKKKYRIRADGSLNSNIDEMHGDRVVSRICCHCLHDIPLYDNYLAQKIALMKDERRFLRIANRHAA